MPQAPLRLVPGYDSNIPKRIFNSFPLDKSQRALWSKTTTYYNRNIGKLLKLLVIFQFLLRWIFNGTSPSRVLNLPDFGKN
jgi:hypothetical protein